MRRAAVRQFIHHCQCDHTPLRPTDMHTRANMTLPLNRKATVWTDTDGGDCFCSSLKG